MPRFLTYCFIILFVSSCSTKASSDKSRITVSIAPLKYIVQSIGGDDFIVDILVPAGSSPETYSPTPQQLIEIAESDMLIHTGLIDFENELIPKISNPIVKLIDLSSNIDLIEGHCSHNHNISSASKHNHGTDPHIWTSPKKLKIMAQTFYTALRELYPDSVKYGLAHDALQHELDLASVSVEKMISESDKQFFVIYHPALTYFAQDYGIEQVSLEDEGKEPSAAHLLNVIERSRTGRIKYILYQSQFPVTTVETVAKDSGATSVQVDPLTEDILEEILYITKLITE